MTLVAEDFGSPVEEHHLACLLLSPSGRPYLEQTLAEISPDDFTDPTYGWMWAASRIINARGEPISKRSLMALRDTAAPAKLVGEPRAKIVTITGLPFNAPGSSILAARIGQIAAQPVYLSRLSTSIRNVREAARLRRLALMLEQAYSAVTSASDYSTALESVHGMLSDMEGTEIPAEVMPFSTLADRFWEWQASQDSAAGIVPTPWRVVNELLSGGLHSGHSVVLAGRPGAGKTNAGLELVRFAAEQGFPSLVISQEMSGVELTGRLVSSGARVPYGQVTKRVLDSDSHAAARGYVEARRDMPLWVVDRPGLTIEYITAVARTMRRKQGLALLVIDYLQLLEATDKRLIREQQVSHISRMSKLLARDVGCAVVLLAQLNRDPSRGGRKPEISDLRESGSLEQDPDAVLMLHHEATKDGSANGFVHLILGKNRYGKITEVELKWNGDMASIEEL